MSCEIIQFSAAARPARKGTYKPAATEGTAIGDGALTPRQLRREGKPELPPPATETAKNSRIRIERRDAWWHAGWVSEYWRARLDWHSALEIAHKYEIGDSASFQLPGHNSRFELVDKWREAVVKQLLTPAPDGAAVAWKRAQLAGRGFSHLPTKAERIERVIADDLAFLAAHPTRRNNSEATARRREFKEAMRRRIRDIAASRDLSDEEIKPALTLKHHEIGRFSQQHGVNIAWLLEGKGRIFEKDPITLNPNMTGSEFAAVVTTLPMADQQAITTMVRELLREELDEAPLPVA
jgi:hypothetical protein